VVFSGRQATHNHDVFQGKFRDCLDNLVTTLSAFIDPMQLPLASQQQLPGGGSAGADVLGEADRGTEDIGSRI
jgi:hypothetical protein